MRTVDESSVVVINTTSSVVVETICNVFKNDVVPIPTLLLDTSTKKSPVFTFTSPENSAV